MSIGAGMATSSNFSALMADWVEVGSPVSSPVTLPVSMGESTDTRKDIYIGVLGRSETSGVAVTGVDFASSPMTRVFGTDAGVGNTTVTWWTINTAGLGTTTSVDVTSNYDLSGLVVCSVIVLNGATYAAGYSENSTVNAPSGAIGLYVDIPAGGAAFAISAFKAGSLATFSYTSNLPELDNFVQSGITSEHYYVHSKQTSATVTDMQHTVNGLAESLSDVVFTYFSVGPS